MSYTRTPHSNSISKAASHNMVAEETFAFASPKHTPIVTRQPSIAIADQPVLPRWQPRSGRTNEFIKWYDALVSLEQDKDFVLDEQQPCYEQVVTLANQTATPFTPTTKDFEMIAKAGAWWQDQSNLFFDVIKASLVLDGPHLERDLRKISSFVSHKSKDARSLRAWAISFADLSSLDSQVDLRSKLDGMKLKAGSDYATLEKHCRDYWASWSHVAGNTANRDGLGTFYMQLLATLPSQPEGAHLTSVRKWLADKITESSPILMDADDTIDTLLKYATVIGLPKATTKTIDTRAQATWIDHSKAPYPPVQSVHALSALKESKCDFCDCYSCTSRDRGGIMNCICRFDSTFDLSRTQFSDATKAYILKLREYHKEHPNVDTLKGVKFKRGDAPSLNALITMDDIINGGEKYEAWLRDLDVHDSLMCLRDVSDEPRLFEDAVSPIQTYRQMLLSMEAPPLLATRPLEVAKSASPESLLGGVLML